MWQRLWTAGPELMATTVLMLGTLAGCLVGLAVDPSVITSAPAWLKPAKFAASIAIYSTTLAWMFTHLPDWPRTRRVVGRATAATMLVEMALIATQAWRGTASHFNVATPFDATVFAIMGIAIVAQTMMSVAVAVALWRQRFADVALGWALRLGMALTIVGAITGGMMTRPTGAQMAGMQAGERPTTIGAHTIGALDGGPGLPGTNWSTRHGDLRVAHFVGLHAMQVLPLVAIVLARTGLGARERARLVQSAAIGYAVLFIALIVQALRGLPIVHL